MRKFSLRLELWTLRSICMKSPLFWSICWLRISCSCHFQLSSQHLLLQIRCGYVLPRGVHSLPAQSSLCNSVCGCLLEWSQPVCHRHSVHIRGFSVLSPSWTEEVWFSCSDIILRIIGIILAIPQKLSTWIHLYLLKSLSARKCGILKMANNLCPIIMF